jgi:hypothetical protein
MNAQILHTTLIRDRVIDAAGETFTQDLPVNPLSGILVTMRALINDANSVAGAFVAMFLAKYTSFRVTYRGATIIQGSAADLLVAMMLRERQVPGFGNVSRVNNDAISITFPLLFGRQLYNQLECFPATRRGDLVFEIIAAADADQLDNHTLQVETVELLDAKPSRFYKVTTIEQAMAAAGQNDIELPIGNKLAGALLRPFNFPDGTTFASSFGEIKLLVDNVEVIEAARNFETAHGMLARRAPPFWDFLEHVHGGLFTTVVQGDSQNVSNIDNLSKAYAYLDWDPLNDDAYMIDTRGAAHVQLRMNSDSADAANTSRVLPIECVELQAPGQT